MVALEKYLRHNNMKEYKNINEVFENWGKENQKLPEGNLILKEKILSKIPFTLEGYRSYEQKRKPLPWMSMAFLTMAILIVIGNIGIFSKNVDMAVTPMWAERGSGIQLETPAVSDQNKTLGNYYYPNQNATTDTREFLKINYNATIKTRNVGDMVAKTEVAVRGFGGRVDESSGGEKYGYVNFSIPASQFEMFKSQIKSLTNAKLFVEEINSTNLLTQKQGIERNQTQANNYIINFKNEKAQIVKNHSQIINSFNSRVDGLNKELVLLQFEWQTASNSRRAEINTRFAQIQTEKNTIQEDSANENSSYQNKLTNVNQKIKDAEDTLQSYQTADQNLIDNVSMVNGTISFDWVSLFELVNIFVSWYWFVVAFLIGAVVSYWRYRMSMRVFI